MLQFTVELENQQKLPFLDMLVIRNDDQSFCTDWYIKPIASGRFLNFHSLHPMHLKINVACNLIKRINTLSTVKTQLEKNKTISDQLKLNDYPSTLINRLLNRESRKHPTTTKIANSRMHEDNNKVYRSIPYIEGLTQQITRCIQQSGEFDNVNIVHYYYNTMDWIYTAMKGRTDTLQRSNVIYCISCQQCDAKYVGLTTNKLQTRIYGHKSDVNLLDKTINIENTSDRLSKLGHLRERTAMIAHCINSGHRFDLQNANILDQSQKSNRLPILEICHIMSTNNINKRTDVDGLNTCYTGIMYTLKKRTHKHNNNNNVREITPTQPDLIVTDQNIE